MKKGDFSSSEFAESMKPKDAQESEEKIDLNEADELCVVAPKVEDAMVNEVPETTVGNPETAIRRNNFTTLCLLLFT